MVAFALGLQSQVSLIWILNFLLFFFFFFFLFCLHVLLVGHVVVVPLVQPLVVLVAENPAPTGIVCLFVVTLVGLVLPHVLELSLVTVLIVSCGITVESSLVPCCIHS